MNHNKTHNTTSPLRAETSLRRVSTTSIMIAVLFLAAPFGGATQGTHPNSETPSTDAAVFFSTLHNDIDFSAEVTAVIPLVEDQNYKSLLLADTTGDTDNDPKDATAENFKKVLNGTYPGINNPRGILYVSSHGVADALMVQVTNTSANCQASKNAYVAGGVFMNAEIFCDEVGGTWGILINKTGIQNHYVEENTIVYLSACKSDSLHTSFVDAGVLARDFVGYADNVLCADALDDAKKFWGRMHGSVDGGTSRWATIAGGKLDYSPLFRYHHRTGLAEDTVLSPAVKDHDPLPSTFLLPAGGTLTINGHVDFDTPMENVDVLDVTGTCDPWLKSWSWPNNQRFEFELQLNQTGDVELRVQQEVAKAGTNFHNNLDGNQDPAGTIHVGPNQDDFVWNISCREQEEDNTTVGGNGGNVGGLILDSPPATGSMASVAVTVAALAAVGTMLLVDPRRKK